MKYTHTIINNAVTNPYIDFINRNFNPDEHRFYVIRGWSQELIKTSESGNVIGITGIKNIISGFRLLKDLSTSEKVFIHGLFTPYLVAMLFFQPWLLKKCSWVIWGGDLYDYVEERTTLISKMIEYMRAKVICKMGSIITLIKGDYEFARKWYKVKGIRENAYYPFSIKIQSIDAILEKNPVHQAYNNQPTNIIIGNSSSTTNRHFEIFNLLKKFQNENIKIHALLAYGDPVYAEKVCEEGRLLFGEKFISVTDYMTYEKFIQFLNNMDILIFNHERQQGLGNLFLALLLKKKVYINHTSTLFDCFRNDLKLQVEKTSDIGKSNFYDFMTIDDTIATRNKQLITEILDEDEVVKHWKALFN